MMFTNVQEAFNHYSTAGAEEIERRAAEIKQTLTTDAGADVDALNIEVEGLRQDKENQQEKRGQQTAFNPITGATLEQRASHELTTFTMRVPIKKSR